MLPFDENFKRTFGITSVSANKPIICSHNLCNNEGIFFYVKKKEIKRSNYHNGTGIQFHISSGCDLHKKSAVHFFKVFDNKNDLKDFIKSVRKMCSSRSCTKPATKFRIASSILRVKPISVKGYCALHANKIKKLSTLQEIKFYNEDELIAFQIMEC